MSTQALYRSDLARLAAGRNSTDYHQLPAHLRGLCDAASEAQAAFLAVSQAASAARSACDWPAVEALDALELLAFNTWQAIEGRGAELLDGARALAPIGGAR